MNGQSRHCMHALSQRFGLSVLLEQIVERCRAGRYGLAAFDGGITGTPNIGFGLSDSARDWRIGWRLTLAARGDSGFEVNLEAKRRPRTLSGSKSGSGSEMGCRDGPKRLAGPGPTSSCAPESTGVVSHVIP